MYLSIHACMKLLSLYLMNLIVVSGLGMSLESNPSGPNLKSGCSLSGGDCPRQSWIKVTLNHLLRELMFAAKISLELSRFLHFDDL